MFTPFYSPHKTVQPYVFTYFSYLVVMSNNSKRIEIIGMYERGYKVMKISKELGVKHQTVSKAIKRFNELGTSADRKIKGRKKKINILISFFLFI